MIQPDLIDVHTALSDCSTMRQTTHFRSRKEPFTAEETKVLIEGGSCPTWNHFWDCQKKMLMWLRPSSSRPLHSVTYAITWMLTLCPTKEGTDSPTTFWMSNKYHLTRCRASSTDILAHIGKQCTLSCRNMNQSMLILHSLCVMHLNYFVLLKSICCICLLSTYSVCHYIRKRAVELLTRFSYTAK